MSSYFDSFRNIAFEQDGPILQMRLHSDGGPLMWGASRGSIHTQLGEAFRAVALEDSLKAVILTGTGDSFCAGFNPADSEPFSGVYWRRIIREGREMLMHLLDIDVPVISAINGSCVSHPELCVLADVVLAVEGSILSDGHLRGNIVAGDGCHVVWKQLLGHSRGNYFLLMQEKLTVEAALGFGVVHEVLARDAVLPRAWAIAKRLAEKSEHTLRHSRMLFTRPLKEAMIKDIDLGFALEGLEMATRD